jgi:hypothetical protein
LQVRRQRTADQTPIGGTSGQQCIPDISHHAARC